MKITCKEASRLISEGQDRKLGFYDRWRLRMHLWICDNCRRFERQVTLLRAAMHSLGQGEDDALQGPNLSTGSKERIRKALAERDQT